MKKIKKIIIFASFWGNPGHVGFYRVERFSRWFTERGYQIVVINSGFFNSNEKKNEIKEITVSDPLKLDLVYREKEDNVQITRKPNKLRRKLAYLVMVPDPHIVWSIKASFDNRIIEECKECDFLISSSPEESMHCGAFFLSKRFKIPHIVDMRDGWLDEPLRAEIKKKNLRHAIEKVLEKKVLQNAKMIFVSSEKWKEELLFRYPKFSSKTAMIPNTYPINEANSLPESNGRVVFAGRLKISRDCDLSILMNILLNNQNLIKENVNLQFIGDYDTEEKKELTDWKKKFKLIGWDIIVSERIPRLKLLEELSSVSGLLLFSPFNAPVPSKLYEYIFLRKPFLVVTYFDSSVWRICKQLPQSYLIDINDSEGKNAIADFFNLACLGKYKSSVPEQFSESYVKSTIKKMLDE